MDLTGLLGYASNIPLIIALVIAVKNRKTALHQVYLVLFALSTTFITIVLFAKDKILPWLQSFQNGFLMKAGALWMLLTSILSFIIVIKWLYEISDKKIKGEHP